MPESNVTALKVTVMLLLLYLGFGTGASLIETALGPPYINMDLRAILRVLAALAVLEGCVLGVLIWQALTKGD